MSNTSFYLLLVSIILFMMFIIASLLAVSLNKFFLERKYPELSKKYKFGFFNLMMFNRDIRVKNLDGEDIFIKNDTVLMVKRISMVIIFIFCLTFVCRLFTHKTLLEHLFGGDNIMATVIILATAIVPMFIIVFTVMATFYLGLQRLLYERLSKNEEN